MKSFFDLSNNLNEAIDQYSPQALGRKRNTMLRALTLDDSEFERWVHDRIVRFAEQNGIPLQQLDVSAFKSGFNEWQQQLQQSDKSYGEVKSQVDQYVQRFMSVAPGIISRYQSGESAPVKEPLSPTMVPYEAQGEAEAQQQQPDEGEELGLPPEPVYAKAPEPVTPDQIETKQRDAMSVIDLVTNAATNKGEDEIRANGAAFKQIVRSLADEIAQANQVDPSQLTYDMMNEYVMSMRDQLETNVSQDMLDMDREDLDMWESMIKKEFAESYGLEQSQSEKDLRAKQIAALRLKQEAVMPEHVTAIPAEHAEIGLLDAIEKRLGNKIVSDKSRRKLDKHLEGVNKQQIKTYFDIQASL